MTVDFPPTTNIGRNALAVLASLPLFEKLEPEALIAVAEHVEWFCLPGGTTLFEQGDEANSLYAVTSGSLGAYRAESGKDRRLIGRIKSGETLGENALVAGGRRTATVIALRDTEMLRFTKAAFEGLISEYPTAMLHIAQVTVTRLEQSLRRENPRASSRTFAVIGISDGVDEHAFAADLSTELARLGRTEVFTGDSAESRSSSWFNEIESRRDFILFVASQDSTAWTRQCIAQADTLILLANAREQPRQQALIDISSSRSMIGQITELVLLHRRFVRPGTAGRWLQQFPATHHHHLRSAKDYARLSRLITGNAVGLVLSGGGARGFAHIGVIKAIRESGIPIDHIGGTSVGSIIASGVAAGWDDEQLVERHRRTFVERNPIGDYTLPLISLARGRRVSTLLRNEVGPIDITDLALPYFCIATNLTQGRVVVYRSGLLWRCLRASVAIPGVLPPVFQDGQIIVDGAVLNNLPVDVMHGFGRGRIIGVDVGSQHSPVACDDVDDTSVLGRFRLIRDKRAPSIFQLLFRAGSLSSAVVAATNREQSSILLTPPLDGIDVLDWKAFDRAREAGYRHAMEHMPAIQAAVVHDRREITA